MTNLISQAQAILKGKTLSPLCDATERHPQKIGIIHIYGNNNYGVANTNTGVCGGGWPGVDGSGGKALDGGRRLVITVFAGYGSLLVGTALIMAVLSASQFPT